MVTTYANNAHEWEPWQRADRFSVLLIYPPDPPRSQVNALRASHDPRSQACCDAHISLTIPLPRPLTEGLWEELRTIASGIAPIVIRYGPLGHYLPRPGVVLAIQPQAELDRLRRPLEMAGAFAGAPPRRYSYSAHMTIAEFIDVPQTEALFAELRDAAPCGEFVCDGVSYAVPDEAMHFSERRALALRG